MTRTIAVLVLLVASAGSARAQGSNDDERARMHFEAGRSYYEEGAYEQALEEFQRAYALSQRAAMLSNIANCEERLGRWADAAGHLEEFSATLAEGAPERATLARRIENLRARAAGATPPPDTSSGDTTTTARAGTPASDGLLVPAVVLMGAGGAALIAWGVLGGLALAEEGRIAGACGATRSCTPSEVQAMDDLALRADISMGIGLALAATGAILLIVDPPHGASSGASLVPIVGPNVAGLALRGRM